MKKTKRLLSTFLAIIMLFGVVSIVANAASVSTTSQDYGYMLTTDAKISKAVETVKVYGNYDYINFYINSRYDDKYFFYEIYSDKKMTKLVASDYTYCSESGTFSWSPMITLKGVFKTGTFYGVTYAAEIDNAGNVTISEDSVSTFKLSVNRSPKFNQKMVPLKSVTNTVNGPTIKWHKLSTDATKYVIYRRSMSGTKWTKVGTVNGSTLSFTDKSVKDKNGKYVYTVKALNKSGTASRYLYNGLSCLFAKAPTVSSVATTSDNRIQVKWNNTSGSAKYRVYRSENGSAWKLIANNVKGTSCYDTTAKSNGKNYKYTVRAVITTTNGDAISSYYNANKTVDFLKQPALSPVEVVETGLKITWEQVAGAENYTVYRKTLEQGASWVALGKVSKDVVEFIDTTANAESSFIYTVRSEGKNSRGSYSSKGVEIVNLAQPEVTITVDSEKVVLSWKAIPGATDYTILEKKEDGSWEPYSWTYSTKFTFSPTRYFNRTFTVQATRGDYKSSFNEDVEPIEFYPQTTLYISNYKDFMDVKWEDVGAEKYNLYRKLKTESDSAYQLIYSGVNKNFKDTTAEYDVLYTYTVKGVYNSQEQPNNFVPKDRIKYSPDKYIKSFSPYIQKLKNDDYGYVSDYEDGTIWYFFDKKEQNLSTKMKENIYYSTPDGWKKVEGSTMYYIADENSKISQFSYVVYDENGSTPIDGFVKEVDIENICFVPQVTMLPTKTGFNVNWNAVENVEKYKVSVEIDGRKFYEKTIEADDSEKYSAEITNVVYGAYSDFLRANISVKALYGNGNETIKIVSNYILDKAPVLRKAAQRDGNIYVMWDANERGSLFRYVVFRKAEGETSWTKISSKAYSGGYTVTINGVEYDDVFYYVDKNVESGKKYTYTVRIYNTETKEYVSYYDTKGISATAK